ncbi:hypothetical protein PFISCL1PPCAC_23050, partial [Pristionchus fissidentatus]
AVPLLLGLQPSFMDLSKSLKLLESQDSRSFEDARRAILIQLDNGMGIKQLVHYYSEQRSERALELLCSIGEPHDKILLDQLAEIFPRHTLNTTILLGQFLQKTPSWVPKIVFHPLFKHVTNYVIRTRQSRIVVEDIAVLLFICALLPLCSNLPESVLKTLSQTFITACELLRQRMRSSDSATSPADDAELVHFSHLHYAVREYFMTLYGIYPNHFMAFLKEYFNEGGEERQKIYRAIVKPMTTLVRYNPTLLELNKKKEIEQARWHQREPHDFLDDCRRVMIGAIPTPSNLGDGPPSEPEETSTVMSDVYRTLFPSKSSGTSMNDVWDHHSHDADYEEEEADLEVEGALMQRIDTPPGTRSHTPMHKDVQRSMDEPMVLDGGRSKRRSTGPSEAGGGDGKGGRKSFRAAIGGIGKLFRSTGRIDQSLQEAEVIGVSEMDAARRNSELEEAEDAMDAIDVDRVETPHAEMSGGSTVVSPVSIAAAAAAALDVRAAARSLRGSMRARTDSTPQKPAAAATPTTPAASEDDGHGGGGVSRSRSTSFLTTASAAKNVRNSIRLEHSVEEEEDGPATATTDRSENTSSNDALLKNNDVVGALGGISESLPEKGHSRFSVSFFTNLNRQRFRSECPPADEASGVGSVEWAAERGGKHDAMGMSGDTGMMSNTSTLKRTTSCPILVEDSAMMMSMSGSGGGGGMGGGGAGDAGRGHMQTDGTDEARKGHCRAANLMEYFPYLALLNEPSTLFYQKLEDDLEEDHERHREMYMQVSSEFHAKLKDLNMADRLPGKIYDDLSHILKGLPVEKQRDMLQTRLSLVNQHLLYERSCRLLHANRNRRLFGRIKQQKVYEAELRMFREKEVKEEQERKDMIHQMTEYRKQLIAQRRQAEAKYQTLTEEMTKKTEGMDVLVRRLAEAEEVAKQATADKERYRKEHDSIMRRAEDAEVELRMMAERFESARKECSRVSGLSTELDQLKDDLQIAERRRREETGGAASPDWTSEDRLRELEGALERSRIETEKLKRDTEALALRKEESERALKSETSKSLEMRAKLDRAARLLNEQNEAAEQKYLSLQLVVRKQEEYIAELFSVVEEAEDRLRDSQQHPQQPQPEREEKSPEDSSSQSEPPVKSPPRRSVLPNKFVMTELASSFFLADGGRSESEPRDAGDGHDEARGGGGENGNGERRLDEMDDI